MQAVLQAYPDKGGPYLGRPGQAMVPDLEYIDQQGRTPLSLAVRYNNVLMTQLVRILAP
jgi:hypothetical protein